MDVLQSRLMAVLTERFGVPADELSPEVTFGDLDLDSLTLVELAMLAKEEFGAIVSEDEFTAELTVAQAAELIASKSVPV